jgi:hypothetical protein
MSKAHYKGGDVIGPDKHLLKCSVCGENDRAKLLIEDLGIAVGMGGDNYTFCMSCWYAPDLGKKLEKLLEISDEGLKYLDYCVEYKS